MTAIIEAPEILPLRKLLRDPERFQVLAADLELVRTLCESDPRWHLDFAMSLAIHDQNEEIGVHVTQALRPVLAAPGLSAEEAARRFFELRHCLVEREKARDDEGRPTDMPRDVWEDRCEAAVDEALHDFTGVTL